MAEISNIDAIIELILREARAIQGNDLIHRTYTVQIQIEERLKEIRDNLRDEVKRTKEADKNPGWNQGM